MKIFKQIDLCFTNVRQQEIVTIRNRLSRLVVSWLAALDARLLLLRLNEELIDEPCSVPWVSKCFIRICDTETKKRSEEFHSSAKMKEPRNYCYLFNVQGHYKLVQEAFVFPKEIHKVTIATLSVTRGSTKRSPRRVNMC
jgi:hypothetical protein